MSETTAGQLSMMCSPGDPAASWGAEIRPGTFGLTLKLAPVEMIVIEATVPDGRAKFVRWCRQLSHAAAQLAFELAPDVGRQDDSMVVVHRMPGGQPFAVEIRPNATAVASRSIQDGITSIRIKEPRRTPLTIVLPEEVAGQIFGVPLAETDLEHWGEGLT